MSKSQWISHLLNSQIVNGADKTQYMTVHRGIQRSKWDVGCGWKYHCILTAVPCLTPLIHLPLPFFRHPVSPSINAVVFFFSDPSSSPPWCCVPSPHSPPSTPLPPSLPHSVFLSRMTPTDRCLFFILLLCPWTLGCAVFDELGQLDIKMHEEPYAGGRDGLFPLQK